MSSVMSDDDPEDAANGTDECGPVEEAQNHTPHQHGLTAVTNAIQAYRRSRQSQERRRAKREKRLPLLFSRSSRPLLLSRLLGYLKDS
jgi:hypothetical protein